MTQIERLATMYPVKPLTSRIPKRIAAVGIVASLGFLAIAAYAMFVSLPGHIKVAPVSIVVHSSSSLPAEVQALEAQTAVTLFDRDTTTAHFAYADQSIDAQFEKQTEIKSVKIYGPSPYELTVQAQQGNSWSTIAGLDKIKLTSQPAAWNSFPATQALTTGALRFVLTLPSGSSGGSKGKSGTTTSTAGGIPEIEIWASGEHALVNGTALVAAMPAGTTTQAKPAQARAYTATPASAVIGKDGQTFRFTLDRPTHRFKRAWLSYEAYGLSHWVSPVRRINGLSIQGGSFTFSGTDWTPLTEPIHPDWLVNGSNRIDFTLPANLAGNYSVRNVRVITELDDGNNFIARATTITGATAKQAGTEIDAPVLTDGDLTTGWSPYVDPRNKTGQPTLTLTFDKPTQLDTLSLNLVNALSGTMSVDLLVAGQWQSAGLPTINGNKLTAGWNNLTGFAQVSADALRITFLNGGGSPGEIRELAASGSGTGTAYVPTINVAYPDAGQFYGREAYIRGFLSVPDNGSGPAAVAIAGKSIATPDGSFGLIVSKEDAGYASQADAEPWQVEVVAIYPDGQKLTQVVKLTQANDASKAHGKLPNAVNPLLLVLGDASLEIAPDATEEGIKIKITPLSEKDLPRLDPGMTNVTRGPHKGYRFTPSPYKFKKNIKVTLPFDSAFVPSGHTENDIKTYYFDTQAGHWVPLDRVLVDGGKKRITSLTNHFTDMINATLTVPDHPEAVSFNPTQIKDIKAADPGAGINLIEPPQANNNGDARLSYPIEIPQGRQGMQPQLAISYNSAGGNGWMGLGWDLSVPSISVETRWGSPRYDASKETETYLLNGEMLTPVAHRGALQNRTAEKVFHTRVEGAFRKIVRHGDAPTNYWWEVTDKNGMKNFYGGTGTTQDADAIQGSGKGVYKWMLRKTVDSNGNMVVYEYGQACDTGIGSGVCGSAGFVDGTQLYLNNVRYTAHTSGSKSPYTVEFVRDSARAGYKRDYNAAGYDSTMDRRKDVQIDTRGGYKQVTAERLKYIIVKFNDATIRSYELDYREAAFGKSVLSAVVQKDANGVEFNRHAMDYYNEVPVGANAGEYNLFGTPQHVTTSDDGLSEKTFTGKEFNQTLIGGTYGRNTGFNGSFGIGFPLMGTIFAGVMDFSANSSTSEGKVSLLDIDGDSKPDKVFLKGGSLKYRKNITQPNAEFAAFGQIQDVSSLGAMSRSSSDSSTTGFNGYAFGAVGFAKQINTTSTDKAYFADVNGDGLIDHVNNGRVTFGHLDNTAQPDAATVKFSGDSLTTPNPIAGTAMSTADVFAGLAAGEEDLRNKNPLMDSVRRWKAPFDGEIRIEGTVQLYDYSKDPDPLAVSARARYESADGVMVAIQKNGAEYWRARIEQNDFNPHAYTDLPNLAAVPQSINRISVKRGDHIYFRVGSFDDGSYDRVQWAPKIIYVDSNDQPRQYSDANKLNIFSYDTSNDTIFAGMPVTVPAPYDGTIHFAGQLTKAVTTDDVKFQVNIYEFDEDSKTFSATPKQGPGGSVERLLGWNEQGTFDLSADINVENSDKIVINLVVDSPIDLKGGVQWAGTPDMYYTSATQRPVTLMSPPPSNSTPGQALPPQGSFSNVSTAGMTTGTTLPAANIAVLDEKGNHTIKLPVRWNADIYSADSLNGAPQQAWKADRDGVLLVTPWLTVNSKDDLCPQTRDDLYWWNPICNSIEETPDGDVTFTIKRGGERLFKQVIQVRNQAVVGASTGYEALALIEVKAGDELFFDFSSRDIALLPRIKFAQARFDYGSATPWKAPFTDTVRINPSFNGAVSTNNDGITVNSGKVIFIARRGAQLLARNDFVLDNASAINYAAELQLNVAAGDNLSFDFFTAEDNVSLNNYSVWSTYPGAAPWSAPRSGTIQIHPALRFANGSASSGSFTLRAFNAANQQVTARSYTVTNGVVSDTGTPLTLAVSAGSTLRFEYTTSQHLLSSDLAQRTQIRIDYADQTPWTVPASWDTEGTGVKLDISPLPVFNFGTASPSGNLTFTVWRGIQQLGSVSLSIANGKLTGSQPLRVQASGDDQLSFVFTGTDAALAAYLQSQSANVAPVAVSGAQAINAPATFNLVQQLTEASALHILMPEKEQVLPVRDSVMHFPEWNPLYGNAYRGWAQAAYLGGGNNSNTALDENKLVLSQDRNQSWNSPVYPAMPELQNNRWASVDGAWGIASGYIQSTRRGLKFIDIPRPEQYSRDAGSMPTAGIVRVPRYSASTGFTDGGGYLLTYNTTNSTSNGKLDLMDLNGDRYPDIITGNSVQYTTPDGGMAEFRAVSATRVTNSTDQSLSYGGGTEAPVGGRAKAIIANEKPPAPGQINPFSFSASMGEGDTDGIVDYMDINGDGLPDRVSIAGGTILVGLNTGYGFAPPENWGSGYINKGKTSSYSLGAGWSSPGKVFAGGANLSLSSNDVGYRLMDMNGDGLPDYIYVDGNGLMVAINYGGSFGPAKRWGRPLKTLSDISSLGSYGGITMPISSHYSLSDGLSTSVSVSANATATFTITLAIVPIFDLAFGGGGNYGETVSQPTVGFNDINGDGYIDSIRSGDGNTLDVALSQIGKTNLLKQVRRPLGARFDIDYIRTGNTYDQPQSKYVMAEVRMFDGVANDTPSAYLNKGTDWQRSTYTYTDGKYDRFERDFLGYKTVTSTQHDTAGKNGATLTANDLANTPVFRKTVQEYSNSHAYDKGLLQNETLFDSNGNPYVATVNTYDFWKLGDSPSQATDPLQLDRYTTRASATLFPRLTRTDKSFYEGQSTAGQSSYTEHGYDALGNVTDFAEGGTAVDPVSAQIAYTSCDSSYIVGKPKLITVNAGGQEMRRREGEFDCSTGNLNWQRAFIDASRNAETKFTWDGYGNLFTIEGAENHQSQRMLLAYRYDTDTNTYPVHVDNIAYGLSSSANYDLKWGKPLLTTDTNGNEISYQYDSVGRTQSVLGPQEKAAGKPWTINFTYVPYLDTDAAATANVSYAKTEHADRSVNSSGQVSYKADTIDTVLFTDGTKRVLQTKKDASVSAGNGTAAQDMMIVSGRVAVDALGRAIAQYYPTASSKGGSDLAFLKTEDDSAKPTVTVYDLLDRAKSTTLPDDTTTTMDYGFGTDAAGQPRFQTIVRDANGNTKQSFRDVRELITSVVEENRQFDNTGKAVSSGKAKITTQYRYDPLKQITKVIDYNQNVTNVEYDRLGRRTVIDNPDTGRVETVYDNASNPIKKITANLRKTGQAIEYDYDYSRLVAIRHPLYPDTDVTYTYGTDADRALNQAGRVKFVKHQSGTETREYGKLGEVVKETIILTAAANGGSNPPGYTTQYDFDSFGRLHKLMMPDGEIITNHYDSGGNLNAVDGTLNGRPYQYLERLDYDRFESRVYLKVGNGVETSYRYDPNNRRLSNLKAGSPGKSAMQDMTYGYDAVGNIKSLIDDAPIPKTNEYGGKLTQTFDYDDLYRLVRADGEYTTAREVQSYKFAMAYDAIHNITHKTQLHTVSKIGGTPRTEAATTYDWAYTYKDHGQTQPHAPTHIGERSFDYDANGNQSGWQNDANGSRRTIVWDEENRIREVQDPKHGASFTYNDQGERKLKKSKYGETAYINQFFTVRNGAIASTHVYAGTSRIVTKVGAGTPVDKSTPPDLNGTGNLSLTAPTGGDIVVSDTFTVGAASTTTATTTSPTAPVISTTTAAASSTTAASTATTSASSLPGQGMAHRSDRANEVARNTEKNKHLNGGIPGGEHGSGNSNAGGNGNAAGTSNNPGSNGGSTGGGNTGGSNAGGNGGGNGTGGNTNGGGAGQGNGREFIFFYHPDHLGSTGYVTDEKALRYEHITYFPFGETWVQESNATWRVPYQFTSKEMDQETGLYYFGARYYDPRTSVWQSADPILGKYLPTGEKSSQLAGLGGVYNTKNLGLYTYGHQNPVLYSDPDGNVIFIPVVLGILYVADKAYAAYEAYNDVQDIRSGEKTVAEVAKDRGTEHAAGMVFGAVGRIGVKAGKILAKHGDEVVDMAKHNSPHMPCSFAPDTLVMTKDGLKPIESLRAGDIVLARDEKTGDQTWKKVLVAYSSLHDDALTLTFVDVSTGNVVESVITTTEHPFYVKEQGWTPAGQLKAGDFTLTASGDWLRIKDLTPLQHKQLAYNMEVEDFHTYFVGNAQVWVHNECGLFTSRLKESPLLVREAERSGKSHQASLDNLVEKLKEGNLNPGIGTKPIGKGISEARSRDGARVYFTENGGKIEILGKSSKENQDKVIKEVLRVFGNE
ncbi:MAG: SpvB/TcaC N-terminal domain-containing protein [Gallionellaceae bacterium]|jgi:RHS repeat-associated protein